MLVPEIYRPMVRLEASPILDFRRETVTGELQFRAAGSAGEDGVTPHVMVLEVRRHLRRAAHDVTEQHG